MTVGQLLWMGMESVELQRRLGGGAAGKQHNGQGMLKEKKRPKNCIA